MNAEYHASLSPAEARKLTLGTVECTTGDPGVGRLGVVAFFKGENVRI
jgi:hypothetical protein